MVAWTRCCYCALVVVVVTTAMFGCHAWVPHRSRTTAVTAFFSSTATKKISRRGGGVNLLFKPFSSLSSSSLPDPSWIRSTSKATSSTPQILGRSVVSSSESRGGLFASSRLPEAAVLESDSSRDGNDSSAAGLLLSSSSSNNEALSSSSVLNMDQTRTIPALEEMSTIFPAAPAAVAVAVEQQQQQSNNLKLWQGRFLVLTCAALCGTNYPLLKILDRSVDSISTTAATALRFALAAVAVGTVVVVQEHQRQQQQEQQQQIINSPDGNCTTTSTSSAAVLPVAAAAASRRGPATWLGAEVGVYYGIAYIAQAMGLHTVDASKVGGAKLVELLLLVAFSFFLTPDHFRS